MFIDPDGNDVVPSDNTVYGQEAINAYMTIRNSMSSNTDGTENFSYMSGFGNPPDDHFNQYGRFMFRDKKNTNNVIIHIGSGQYFLSHLNYKSWGTLKAVSNVLAYYGSQKGINGFIGVGTYDTGSAHTNLRGNIFFNSKELSSGLYNNFYNIRSTLNHEGGLLGHKYEKYLGQYTFAMHSQVYLNEALNSDFNHTTDEYKSGHAGSFVNHVLNADVKENRYGTNHLNMLDAYNTNEAGVRVGIYTGGGLTTGAAINVSVNGRSYKTKKYEDIKIPQH